MKAFETNLGFSRHIFIHNSLKELEKAFGVWAVYFNFYILTWFPLLEKVSKNCNKNYDLTFALIGFRFFGESYQELLRNDTFGESPQGSIS